MWKKQSIFRIVFGKILFIGRVKSKNKFLPMETTNIPIDSIVREFIGNGCFYR